MIASEVARRCLFPIVSVVMIPAMLVIFVLALVFYTIDAWIHPPPCKKCPEYGLGDRWGCEWLRKGRF